MSPFYDSNPSDIPLFASRSDAAGSAAPAPDGEPVNGERVNSIASAILAPPVGSLDSGSDPCASIGLDRVIEAIGDAVCVVDDDLVFLAANSRFSSIYGLEDPRQIIGKSVFDLYPGFASSVFYQTCLNTIASGHAGTRMGYSVVIKTWVVLRCSKMAAHRYAIVMYRLSAPSSASGAIGLVDELTLLPNLAAFDQDIASLEHPSVQALAILDIGHFKQFNETLGYESGNQCLIEVASRIKQSLQSSERLYRIGSDRFLVTSTTGLVSLRQTLRAATQLLAMPMSLQAQMYRLHFHLGLAHRKAVEAPLASREPAAADAFRSSPDSNPPADPRNTEASDSCEALLSQAEHALHLAKHRRSGWEEYRQESRPPYDIHHLQELHDAMSQSGLELFLQPQIGLSDGTVRAAEALVRWRHPTRGLLAPAEFLPMVEATGMAYRLDAAILEMAFDLLREWNTAGSSMVLSVNLFSDSVGNRDTVALIAGHLARTGIDPATLCIEITEGSMIQDVAASQWVVEQLKAMGLTISIDDFGTGYCSMSYLLRYPSNSLKIDRFLVHGMDRSPAQQVTARNIIALAHGLGIGVIAEGVETAAEEACLRQMGCDVVQGYLHAEPMPQSDFPMWLSSRFAADDGRAQPMSSDRIA